MEDMIKSGDLAVVNVYIDEDLGEWYGYMGEYPLSWYNVYVNGKGKENWLSRKKLEKVKKILDFSS